MHARVLTSSASTRRLERARAWLGSRSPAEELLIVGASLNAANDLARNLASEKGSAFGWHRMTLRGLTTALAQPLLAEHKLTPLSRLGSEAIAARAVHRLRQERGLGRYEPIAGSPGFSRAIARVLGETRLTGLTADTLGDVEPDLAPIMRACEAEMADAGLADWADITRLATYSASSLVHRLAGLPILMLDQPITSEAEAGFIRAFAGRAPELLATVPAADQPTLTRIGAMPGWEIEHLDEEVGSLDQAHGAGAGCLQRLQRGLFTEQSAIAHTPSDGEVTVFSAPGESRECVEIARHILQLAREGVSFDTIAVVLRSPEAYRPHLEEAFARARIPAHFARGAVRPDPTGRAFHALLRCAAEGLSAHRFAEYLSLGQIPDADSSGAPPKPAPAGEQWVTPDPEHTPLSGSRDEQREQVAPEADDPANEDKPVTNGQLRAPRRWERLLVDAAVIGGPDRWRRRLNGLAHELRLRLAGLVEDDASVAGARRTLQDLEALSNYALPLIDELGRLPASADWGLWLDHLGALATRTLKHPDRVLSVLAELAPMKPVGPVTLAEITGVLEELLLGISQPPPSQRYGKVFVAPVEAVRGLSFQAVFVPGLAEKMFPRKIVEEPILLDATRRKISPELATNQARLEQERLALALAAGSARQQIFFSYPRLDLDQARPRVPSFYALETVRAAEGRLPDFTELAKRAETATTARLGWPAPPDPSQAIDDAEYDLATLELIAARTTQHPGTARYLLSANASLARALRARFQRWGRTWTSADGLMSRSASARNSVASHALSVRSYSPTALQHFASCPYRFFLRAIIGLAPRDVAASIDELDALQRGSLIHEIQFELLARLRNEGLLPVRPGNLHRAWQILDPLVADIADRHREELSPAIERVWEDGIAAIRGDLREWLQRMSEEESGFVPLHFELSFGLSQRPEQRQADERSVAGSVDLVCGIQLRGSIDLVEGHPDNIIRVTDHKTGKATAKSGQIIDGGKSLQPLLYALAAEQLFAGEARVASGRLYFCTSKGGFGEHSVPLDERARDAACTLAEAVSEAISTPFLPAAPDRKECDRCDYRVVCGPYEERRAVRKPREELRRLLELRALP